MTEHQKLLLLKLNQLMHPIGWFQGVAKGAYFLDDEVKADIEIKKNQLNALVLELQNLILGEAE